MVSKTAVLTIGAVVLLAVFASAFTALTKGGFTDAMNAVTNLLRYRKMDVTSPEELEQLLECLQQRAINCETVNKEGYWTELKDTPFEGCPCGGNFMAGTDVYVHFKFKDTESYEIPNQFADFGEVKDFPLKCNVRVTGTLLEKAMRQLTGQSKYYLLVNNQNEGQTPLTIINDTEAILVVNTFWSLNAATSEFFGLSDTDRLVQGCIVIKRP